MELYDVDLTQATWRKSTFSNPENCVDVARFSGGFAVRDSKHPEKEALRFTVDEWTAFVQGARAGEFS